MAWAKLPKRSAFRFRRCGADLCSGHEPSQEGGLKRLLDSILGGKVGCLVITHQDQLLRLGAELVFAIREARDVEVVILKEGEDTTFEQDLAKDVLEIITVFSVRLCRSRSPKKAKLIESVCTAAEAAC